MKDSILGGITFLVLAYCVFKLFSLLPFGPPDEPCFKFDAYGNYIEFECSPGFSHPVYK